MPGTTSPFKIASAAIEIGSELTGINTKILYTSTAHRVNSDWAYGFPELSENHREKIKSATKIAVPGCHASGFISIVYPLIKAGIMPKDYPVCSYSVTGYSGGGKKMIAEYQDKERIYELESPRQYGLGQKHKHLPEMTKISGLSYEPIFSPIVADFYSGMTVSVPVYTRLLNKKVSVSDIYELFKEHYNDEKAIKVFSCGSDVFLGTNILSGNDGLEIIISGNDERILLASRFDNLGKGSSGAAVQCMNLMLGIDEYKGLVL